MTPYGEPMELTRVFDETGSHFEPELDQDWSEFDKIRWQMGVVLIRSGLKTRLYETDPGQFCINIVAKNSIHSLSSRDYYSVWTMLSHISLGGEIVREFLDNPERSS